MAMAGGKKITAQDVAELAGVSRATVSRAFDPTSRISEVIRRKILNICNDIGYRPTPVGRLVVHDDKGIVALIVRDITNPVRAAILSQLTRELERANFLPLVFQVPDADSAVIRLETVFGYLPKVIITSGFAPPRSMLTQCGQRSTPVLVVNRGRIEGLAVSYVTSNHFAGGQIAAQEFRRLGVTNLGMVTGRTDTDASEERARGFMGQVAANSGTVCTVFEGDHSYESGFAAALVMLSAPIKPDGVFCSNDMMAIGFIDSARTKFGISLPSDIQVIGYDNIEMAAWHSHAVTTVAQDMPSIISEAVKAVEALAFNPAEVVQRVIPVALLRRTSTQ